MRLHLLATGGLAISLVASVAGLAQVPAPYRESRTLPLTYNGPGRDDPEPANVATVNIGYFGPTGTGDFVSLWQGASLAVSQANKNGGYRGVPFRLVPSWSDNPWAGGDSALVRSIYKDELWGIIGGIDGSTTHLVEQITTKLQIALINPIATDRTIHTANVPWVFSCVPGDNSIALLVARALAKEGSPFAVLSGTDHDSRALLASMKAAFVREQISPVLHVEFETADRAGTAIVERLTHSSAKSALVLGGIEDTRAIVLAARKAGFSGRVYVSPLLARAGDRSLRNVVTPVLGGTDAAFREAFVAEFGAEPDYAAAHAYDAASILIAAIRNAGLNRARIRDEIRELSPYIGVTGRIEWDALGQNQRPAVLRDLSEAYVRAGK